MVERPIVATASKHSPDFFQKGPRQPVGPKAGAPTEGQNKGSAQRDAIKALAAVTPKIVEHRGAAGTLAQAMPGGGQHRFTRSQYLVQGIRVLIERINAGEIGRASCRERE